MDSFFYVNSFLNWHCYGSYSINYAIIQWMEISEMDLAANFKNSFGKYAKILTEYILLYADNHGGTYERISFDK